MAAERIRRKLAAILYADAAGYSRLTGEDEEGTHRTLSEYLDAIAAAIEQHNGTALHFAGDAVLADFSTVSDALICAVNTQRNLESRNKDLPDNRKVQFRFGINLGEVIVDRGEIYGDGVNVAARLEALAEPGGICISASVYDAIGRNLPLDYEFLGEQSVKNIEKRVRAYAVHLRPEAALPTPSRRKSGWFTRRLVVATTAAVLLGVTVGGFWWFQSWRTNIEPASVARMAFPLPEKPSIAVLPFTNMSGNRDQEYFADGMTEDLITDLSKISGLFVIARNSTFTYKGKAVKVQRVAEELGVRYVLEGSVRRAGGQVRINAQLIDAVTGRHLWAERYDGSPINIFEFQDKVTGKVVEALELRLTMRDKDRRDSKSRTHNPKAHDLVLQARKLLTRFDAKAADEARDLLNQAIELDPNYGKAYSLLGLYYFDGWRLWGENQDDNLTRSLELGRAAIKLSPLDPAPHVLLAQVHQFRREFEAANAEADAAIALGLNDAVTLANLGSMLRYAHRPEEAARVLERALRLDPYHPPNYMEWLGDSYFLLGRLNDCVEAVERGIALEPDFIALHVIAAKCYPALGDGQKARKAKSEVLRINPGFTLGAFASYVPFSNKGDLQRNVEMLRKAGLPD